MTTTARKIAFIGATGTFFNPAMMYLFVRDAQYLDGSKMVLYGRQPSALLDAMVKLGQRMIQEKAANLTIEATTDRKAALEGADFVIATFGVGGIDAWLQDLEIPERHDVRQTAGDTNGPGGIFRGLRTIPYLVQYAREMEELCPDAYLLHYINPLSANNLSMTSNTKIKAVGLCSGYVIVQDALANILGVDADDLTVLTAGLNHCTWVLDLRFKDGSDAYPRLRELAPQSTEAISAYILEVFGYWPSPLDFHICEFFPWFHRKDADPDGVFKLERLDRWLYEDFRQLVSKEYKAELEQKIMNEASGAAPVSDWSIRDSMAMDIITSIVSNRNDINVVNVANKGYISNLPDGATVEVNAVINSAGIHPINIGPLPNSVVGHSLRLCAMHELLVEAALEGDKRKVLQAFSLDPLTNSMKEAEIIAEEMFAANADLLPNFR